MTTPPTNLRQFPAQASARTGFVLTLREYEQLAQDYVKEMFPASEQTYELMRLSKFVLWLRKRQEVADVSSCSDR